jgi:cytochrome c5
LLWGPESLSRLGLIALFLASNACNTGDENVSTKTKQQYTKYCARCHNVGAANAPRLGDAESWKKRLRKGRPALVNSIKKGLVAMPPMGDCVECTDQDLEALVNYLAQ